MPIIWGLDLNEIKWSKFKSSYMWNNEYHLRKTKFIVYQAAMIFSVVSESLGTAALSDYLDQQTYVQGNYGATIHNNDIVGAFSYNIFCGVFVAFIFGAAFFFDLFWPERHEDRGIKLAWRYCAIAAAVFELASAFLITILVSTHEAYISGAKTSIKDKIELPLDYNHNKRAIASVVFVWPGALFTIASAVILWMSYSYTDRHGPKSTHARERDAAGVPATQPTTDAVPAVEKDEEKAESSPTASPEHSDPQQL